ncbi:MAG TPA: hypothetical protein H9776_10400 [Candidatus Mediterraneibacter intestinipullorum]|mgnify:CR=1 FL=1|nr:hypothetical protein [Candidatus Mediterraneibacter intestinipullorum]
MLDKRKIRLMTKAAIYEKEYGEEDLKIAGYYKKDYTSLNTWITLIWITVGYVLLVGIIFLCYGENMMEGITITRLLFLGAVALALYLALMIMYGIGAGNFYSKKHIRAKQRVKKYLRDISRLEKMNKKRR